MTHIFQYCWCCDCKNECDRNIDECEFIKGDKDE